MVLNYSDIAQLQCKECLLQTIQLSHAAKLIQISLHLCGCEQIVTAK